MKGIISVEDNTDKKDENRKKEPSQAEKKVGYLRIMKLFFLHSFNFFAYFSWFV